MRAKLINEGLNYKFKNLATGDIEEWYLYEERWRRIPVQELKKYITSLRDKFDEIISEIE